MPFCSDSRKEGTGEIWNAFHAPWEGRRRMLTGAAIPNLGSASRAQVPLGIDPSVHGRTGIPKSV
jgi:hypothetical protein